MSKKCRIFSYFREVWSYSALCAIKASLNNIDQNEKVTAIDYNIIHEKGCTTNMDLKFSLCCLFILWVISIIIADGHFEIDNRGQTNHWTSRFSYIFKNSQNVPLGFYFLFSPLTDFRLFRHRLGLLYSFVT